MRLLISGSWVRAPRWASLFSEKLPGPHWKNCQKNSTPRSWFHDFNNAVFRYGRSHYPRANQLHNMMRRLDSASWYLHSLLHYNPAWTHGVTGATNPSSQSLGLQPNVGWCFSPRNVQVCMERTSSKFNLSFKITWFQPSTMLISECACLVNR